MSPLGVGTAENWSALLEGRSGIGPITRFDASDYPSRIAGEVKGFDPLDYLDKKEVKKSDTFIHYALAAAQFALEDSGLVIDEANADRVGVVIGSGIGGLPLIESMHKTLLEQGAGPGVAVLHPRPDRQHGGRPGVDPLRRRGARTRRRPRPAPRACTRSATPSASIQHGEADAMIAGGAEAVITPLAMAGFCAMRALSTRNDEPEKASRPWDAHRDGFVMGEGAGIVDPGRAGDGAAARRADLCRGRGLRHERRRLPHLGAASRRGTAPCG